MRRATALAVAATLGVIALAGAMISPGAATPLVQGWNNVAYMGPSAPPAEALSSIAGKYAIAYRWDPIAGAYEVHAPEAPSFASTLTMLNTGDAIWLRVTEDGVDLQGPGGGAIMSDQGTIAIAASTFQPASDLALYEKTFNELSPVGTDIASQRYYAPVVLPDGATVTSMTGAYLVTSGEVHLRLDYTPISNGTDGGQVFKLVEIRSGDGPSPQTVQAFQHTVDNTANVYFLIVDLTGGADSKLHGVSIAYTIS